MHEKLYFPIITFVDNEVKRPLREQRNMFGARIKIMWEEHLVDPPIHYLTCVIVP